MLIGQNKKVSNAVGGGGDIFDVTSATFETTALKESLTRPVLIEFWAPWCGPCKQLMPILEGIVANKGGELALGKVNIDENPELAQAFRVQSVPMVVALYQGQPVTAFAGVRPQADIEKLADQLIAMHRQNQPESLNIPESLKAAATFLADADITAAQELYTRILAQDATQVDAYVGLVRVMIAADALPEAEAMIENAPETMVKDPRFTAAKTAYQLAVEAPKGDVAVAEKALAREPRNIALHCDLAALYFAKGQKEQAADTLLAAMKIDRMWEEERARKQLLTYLEAWGFADPVSVGTRRKLSTLLFS